MNKYITFRQYMFELWDDSIGGDPHEFTAWLEQWDVHEMSEFADSYGVYLTKNNHENS